MRRKLNHKLVLWTLVGILAMSLGVHLLHQFQVNRHAENLLRQAERALEKGKFEQGLRLFNQYLSFRPDDVDSRGKYALILDKNSRDRVEAAGVLEGVLRLDPDRKDIRYRLIHCLIVLHRFPEAIQQIQTLLPTWDKAGELEHLAGWCHEAQGRYDQAVEWFRKALAANPTLIDTYVLLAEVLEKRLAEVEKANQVMDDMIKANDTSFRAYLARARYRHDQKRITETTEDLHRALELAPREPEVLLAAADWARSQGHLDEARKYLDLGLEVEPKNEGLYRARARLEIAAGKNDDALAILEQGLEKNQESKDLLVLAAEVLMEQGRLDQAERKIGELRSRDISSSALDYLQARLHVQRKQWAEALGLLEKIQRQPGSPARGTPQVDFLLGLCYQQTGNLSQQLTFFRRAVEQESNWPAAHLGLGTAYLNLGRLDEAIPQFQQVIQGTDVPPGAWTEWARCLLLKNLRQMQEGPGQVDWTDFNKALARADQAQPRPVEVPLLRAERQAAQKNYTEAEVILVQARKDFPKSLPLECALAELARRRQDPARAVKILDQAEKTIGDSLELRQARLRLATSSLSSSTPNFLELADNLQAFSPTERLRWLRELAEACTRQGNLSWAEELCRRLLKENPQDLRSRSMLLDLYLQTGKLEQAREQLAELEKREGDQGVFWRHGKASLLVAESRGSPKKLAQARTLLAQAYRLQEDWGRLPLLEARIDEREGNLDRASQHYLKAFDLGERSPRLVYRLVQLLQERQNYPAAQEVLRRYEEQAPLTVDLARLGAEVALANSNPDRALVLARQAVSPQSRDYRDYLWLAQIDQRAGQTIQAGIALNQAVQLAPHTPDTWVALLEHLSRTGQTDEIVKSLEDMRKKIQPAHLSFTLAQCHEAMGRPEEAERYYQQALTERPDDFIILLKAADFQRRQDQPDKAKLLLEKLLLPTSAAPGEIQARARRELALLLAYSTLEPPASVKEARSREEDLKAFQSAMHLLDTNVRLRGPSPADERTRALVLGCAAVHFHKTAGKKEEDGKTSESGVEVTLQKIGETLLRQDPGPDELFFFARLCDAAGNQSRARTLLLDLVVNYPDNMQYLAQYILTQLQSGDLADAQTQFQKLAQREPTGLRTQKIKHLLLRALNP